MVVTEFEWVSFCQPKFELGWLGRFGLVAQETDEASQSKQTAKSQQTV